MKKVIDIKTKSKFLFYIIVFMLIITIIIGFMCCKHKSNKTIKLDCETIEIIETTETTIENTKTTIETENNKDGDTNQAVKPVSLGNFKLTAYCSCSICCGEWAYNRPIDEYGNEIVYGSIGERLTADYSIAVDPNVIPYGTEVIINNHTYKAQDCGGAIDGNEIDVYFDDHQKALIFGVQYAEVYIKNNY